MANASEGRVRRRWWSAALAAVATLAPMLAATVPARAATATIVEYPVPRHPEVEAIVKGPDGNMWFTETDAQRVARISPAGVVTEFAVAGHPTGITVGPDDNLWFIEPQDKLVGRISTDGRVLDQFPVPWLFYPQGQIQGISLGPDHHVWIADPVNNMIGWIDTTGVITAYQVQGGPFALTPGPDGKLWYTERFANRIGKLDPVTGTVLAQYDVPRIDKYNFAGLDDIVAGPDGNLWFTEEYLNNVGRITPDGTLTLFHIPTDNAGALGITVGPDDSLWFAESTGNRIGRITTAGDITEIHVPTPRSFPVDVATGPDGNLWFTEARAGQIGKLDPTTVAPPPPPCLVVTESLTLTHDIGPCPGAGIVVRADNITVNLNGHKVFAVPGPRFGDFPGIVLAGVSGVTVSKGTVTGFDAGVAVNGGSGNILTRLNVHDNLGVADPAAELGDGIVLFHSSANRILNNVVKHNGMYDGIGVLGLDSNNNVIQGNRVVNNTDAGYPGLEGEGTGIIFNPFLELGNPRRGESLMANDVIDNVVRDNVDSGISSLSNVGGVIRGNTVVHNGFRSDGRKGNDPGNGIGVQANQAATPNTRNIIDSNRISDNFSTGIQVMSRQNRVARNSVTSNGENGIQLLYGRSDNVVSNTATGNVLFDLLDAFPDCDANVWMGNVWSGAASPPCTQVGGHQVPPPAAATPRAVAQSPPLAVPAQEPSAPVRLYRRASPPVAAG